MKWESKLLIVYAVFISCCWSFSTAVKADESRALAAVRQMAPGKVIAVDSSAPDGRVIVRVLTERGRVETYEWTVQGGARMKGGER